MSFDEGTVGSCSCGRGGSSVDDSDRPVSRERQAIRELAAFGDAGGGSSQRRPQGREPDGAERGDGAATTREAGTAGTPLPRLSSINWCSQVQQNE